MSHRSYPSTPLEALESAITRSYLLDRYRGQSRRSRPGEVIEDLSPEHRKLLTELSSNDTLSIRPDAIFGVCKKHS